MLTSRFAAPFVAFAAPVLLYGGALVSQYGFGLHPCEMCYWQRWPHQAAILLALLALLLRRNELAMRALTLLAAVAIAISEAVGGLIADDRYALLVQESVVIGGWVALWHPINIFLYDWWPIRASAKLYERLSRADVQLSGTERGQP